MPRRKKTKRTRSFSQPENSQDQNPNSMTEEEDHSQSIPCLHHPQNSESHENQQQQQAEDNQQQAEEEEDQEEAESQGTAISPPNPPPSAHDSDPTHLPVAPRRGGTKRKKPTRRKRDAVDKKLRLLRQNLCPVPFTPVKTLDLCKHEDLFKTLGLWDFAHLEHDQCIRSDLLAILIANYDSVGRCSYVKEQRINVSRPDLGRALKLPVKKEKPALTELPDSDREGFSEESIAVVSEFMSTYMLLHEDTWMMPEEILASERLVKEGQPQKVDWAGLIWFMAERELSQAADSGSCYYASHLQCLMKSQKPDIFKENEVGEVSIEEDENAAVTMTTSLDTLEEHDLDNPGIELSLGQEKNAGEHVGEDNVMNSPEHKEESSHWFLNGREDIGMENTMRHCSLNASQRLDKEAEVEQYDCAMNFHKPERLPSDDLIQEMETTNVSYGMTGNLIHPSSVDFLTQRADMDKSIPLNPGGLSMFGNSCKREIHDEDVVRNISRNDHRRKMKDDRPWGHTPEDFEQCIEQAQSWLNKARAMHEEKEEAYAHVQMNLEYLSTQLQQRDNIIHSLQGSVLEEQNKTQVDTYRLQHELCVMTRLLHGYKKALKETNAAFAEYRERFQQPDEPIYKDVGNGGGVLSMMELEKHRLEKEEEDRRMPLKIEETVKAFESDWLGKFDSHLNRVDLLNETLTNLVKEVGLLKEHNNTEHMPI